MKRQKIQERIDQTLTLVKLDESVDGQPRRVQAIGITADVRNANGRRYPRAVLERALADLNSHINESAGQGRLVATGEAEHPSDKGGHRSLLETVIKWQAATMGSDGKVLLEGALLPTSKGKDIQVLIENGVPVGVSMRGYGLAKAVKNGAESVQEVQELTITGFDLVADPSDPYARLVESRQEEDRMEEDKEKDLQKQLDEAKNQQTELAKQLDEAKKAQTELAERKRTEAVNAAVTEATKDLGYSNELNTAFVEAVRAAQPTDVAAVKPIVEAKRKEWDAILSQAKLTSMGRVEVVGPVFEKKTGQPAFTQAAWELTESIAHADNRVRRDLAKVDDPASVYARRYLERYDQQYKAQLIREAQMFTEAEQASDLNLPYSVMRAVVEQVWPEVIAANVFDFGIAGQSPERLYFETYAGESGASAVVVTNEAVTGDHDNFVVMANKRLNPGSVVLTNNTGITTYTEGTDYVVDYANGWLKTLSTGATTDSQALLIDYTYEAMRKGEMVGIERAKNTLAYKTLEIAADRMATEISSEAVVFSRSQLGYDALGRTLLNLTRNIQRKIDKDILYSALAASLAQANNSGGTWTAANDAVEKFVQYLGVAKTKVYNRYYIPTALIMSQTNADRLSNWEGFTRVGFPNAMLNAAGFAGSVKGLPIFASPVFSDKYALAVNRELVMHRVLQAMTLKGPFPSYSSGKMVSADAYFVEEYNGTDVPVIEKGSYVIIA